MLKQNIEFLEYNFNNSKTFYVHVYVNYFFFNRISKQTWMSGQKYVAFNETMPESLKKRRIHNHFNVVDKNSIYNIKVINILSEKFVLSRINRRIEIATKLKTIGPHASEDYQVANYGLGNQLYSSEIKRFTYMLYEMFKGNISKFAIQLV